MSNPYVSVRTGRTRTFVWSGEFTTAQHSLDVVYPPIPTITYGGFWVADGEAAMSGVFSASMTASGVVSGVNRNGLTLQINFPNSVSSHDDGGVLSVSDWDGIVAWQFSATAEEWIDYSAQPPSTLTDAQRSEADYSITSLKTRWFIPIGGSFSLTASCSVGGLAAHYSGTASQATELLRSPVCRSRLGFFVREDSNAVPPDVWQWYINNPSFRASQTIIASLTGPWAPEDQGAQAQSGTLPFGGSWGVGFSSGVATARFNSTFAGLLPNSATDWTGVGVSVYGNPATRLNLDVRMRLFEAPHPMGDSWFQLATSGIDLHTGQPYVDIRPRLGSGVQVLYDFEYDLWGVPTGFVYKGRQVGSSQLSIPANDLSAIGGGHIDQRVLIRGRTTRALTYSLAPSTTLGAASAWTNLGGGAWQLAVPIANQVWSGYRFFQIGVTGAAPTAAVQVTLKSFGSTVGQFNAVMDSGGSLGFDTVANVLRDPGGNRTDGSDSILGCPGHVDTISLTSLPTGTAPGDLSGYQREPGSLRMSALGKRLWLRSDGRTIFNLDSSWMGRGSDFTTALANLTATYGSSIAGLILTPTSLGSSPSGGDLYQLGGAGAVFDGTWTDYALSTQTGLGACELFDTIDVWPGSGDMYTFGALDQPTPIRATKILGACVEGVVCQRLPSADSGFVVAVSTTDDGVLRAEAKTQSTGTYSTTSILMPPGSVEADPFHTVTLQLEGASPLAIIPQTWQNRAILRGMFLTDLVPPLGPGRPWNSIDDLGRYVRAWPLNGITLKRAGTSGPPFTWTNNLATTTGNPVIAFSQHPGNAFLLAFSTSTPPAVNLVTSSDDGQSFGTLMATIPNCTQAFVAIAPDGAQILAGFRYDSGSSGPGKIVLKTRVGSVATFSSEIVIQTPSSPTEFTDGGFAIACCDEPRHTWVLAATEFGTTSVSEWVSSDHGVTWTPLP